MKRHNTLSFVSLLLTFVLLLNLTAFATESTETQSDHVHDESCSHEDGNQEITFPSPSSVHSPHETSETSGESKDSPSSSSIKQMPSALSDISTSRSYTPEIMYTPNGTPVAVYFDLPEFNESSIQQLNNAMGADYPNAILISDASNVYNCHSYAWYSQNVLTNNVWMDYPIPYYDVDTKCYVEVSTPQIGDIICYFEYTGRNIHSGIVVELLGGTPNGLCEDANRVMVQSKWGPYGLYQHRGDECYYVTGNDEQNKASYVKYYRKQNHTHSFQESYSVTGLNGVCYKEVCTGCSVTVLRLHDYTYAYYSYTSTTHEAECQNCDDITTLPHTITLTITGTHHIYTCPCGYTLNDYHSYDDLEDENGNWYEQCMICGYINRSGRSLSQTDMEALPANILKQLADQYKTGAAEFFVRVDSKTFVCYKNGGYYLIQYTHEQSDITPVVPPALLE